MAKKRDDSTKQADERPHQSQQTDDQRAEQARARKDDQDTATIAATIVTTI